MRNSLLILALLAGAVALPAADTKILVYTRNHVTNGKGYVHDNIASSVEAIRKLGAAHGFKVDAADSPDVFTTANLKQYRALVFSNSNNEAFENDAQRDAFKAYIQAGGGFVGLHSASGSERKWPYYWEVLGASFHRHPKFQPFTVTVKDSKHPATRELGESFQWADECYYHIHLKRDVHVLLTADPKKLDDPKLAADPGEWIDGQVPLAWCQKFDGGREFYLALGHKKEDYANPVLLKLILGGIEWAMGVAK